jgi:tRNA threonylcarbamoyladenosine modification (KEOPS) complex  Pcc1 subunit
MLNNFEVETMAVTTKTSIRLNFSDPKQLAATITALKPEINSPVTHRANADLQVYDCFLVLNITAKDTVALRAMTNVYLRWIASIVNILEVIEHV